MAELVNSLGSIFKRAGNAMRQAVISGVEHHLPRIERNVGRFAGLVERDGAGAGRIAWRRFRGGATPGMMYGAAAGAGLAGLGQLSDGRFDAKGLAGGALRGAAFGGIAGGLAGVSSLALGRGGSSFRWMGGRGVAAARTAAPAAAAMATAAPRSMNMRETMGAWDRAMFKLPRTPTWNGPSMEAFAARTNAATYASRAQAARVTGPRMGSMPWQNTGPMKALPSGL